MRRFRRRARERGPVGTIRTTTQKIIIGREFINNDIDINDVCDGPNHRSDASDAV
jgi:hypothetical protein